MSDYHLLTTLEAYTTPLSHILIACSTIPLLLGIAVRKRTSIYVTPETLILQSLAALLRFNRTSYILQLAQVILPAVSAWWVIRNQRDEQQHSTVNVEPLLTDDKDVESAPTATNTNLVVRSNFLLISILAATALSCFTPYTLPCYAIIRLLNLASTYPTSYLQSFAYQAVFLSTSLDLLQSIPQHSRSMAVYAIAPSRQQLGQSPIRQTLTAHEKQTPKAPCAVWSWIAMFPLGVTARLPAMTLHMLKADDTKGGQAAAEIILLCIEVSVSIVFVMFMGMMRFAPRITDKSARD